MAQDTLERKILNHLIMKKLAFTAFASIVFISCSVQKHELQHESTEMTVMTFNIRLDHAGDKENNWKFRKERVVKSIQFYEADIAGMQEVLHNQLLDLQEKLKEYSYLGVGRADGKEKGEYSPLFYKTKKYAVISSGTFWLSETPDSAGRKGWDAAIERIATWAKFKDKSTGKSFFVLNTHFDHIGSVARLQSGTLIMQKVNELAGKMPVVVMGDFNASPDTQVVKNITNSSNPLHLSDSRAVSPLIYGPEWSFHDFGRTPLEERELIDYIFVKNRVKVLKYGVLAEQDGAGFLSDHCPVLVKVQF